MGAQQEADQEAAAGLVDRATAVLQLRAPIAAEDLPTVVGVGPAALSMWLMQPLLAARCSARPRSEAARRCGLERQPGFEPGSSARVQELYRMSYCRYLFVWLLITGWLTLWRRRSRVGPALLMHHPDFVLPAGPPVCAGLAVARIGVALLHAAGAPSVRAGS